MQPSTFDEVSPVATSTFLPKLLAPCLLATSLAGAAGCSRPVPVFSERNARAHVNMLADTIGSRPAGTLSNARARAYVIEQLRQTGFQVRVQETDARRRDLGITARVSNIIAVLPGERPEAIGLLSHFDSVWEGPGAADNAFGVAVALETARVAAARPNRPWSLFVLVTDAEESGLMGAAALIGERDVTDRLRAYLNVEAIGSDGVPVLFETGPGNGWLTAAWARNAPHPRGGSYAIEIYKRLPNDTDFSVLKTLDIPGLNFAAIGDSYAYHTPRDAAQRLSARTLTTMGENAVAIVDALQDSDITLHSTAEHTFFDVAGTWGINYGQGTSTVLSVVGLLLAVLAWARIMRTVVRASGLWRWLVMALWTAGATVLVCAAMIGVVWLLRASREVYHPWYAHPGRLVALIMTTGIAAGWAFARAGRLLPARAHGARHPAITWSLTLPIWIPLAATAFWFVPAASYLWTLPLLAAGVLLLAAPPDRDIAVRAASVLVLVVAGLVWVRDAMELVRFMVAVMGRFTFITPVFLYPALIATAGVMVAPPLIAAGAPTRPLRRPTILTTLLLAAIAATAGLAYTAPAYTYERPLRRHVRALQEAGSATAVWEVGSVEPGLDLDAGAPAGFAPAGVDPVAATIPWGRLTFPFVFRTTTAPLGPPPASVVHFSTSPVDGGSETALTVVPQQPGIVLSFVLPADLTPARSNLPGVLRAGRWTATFVAPPEEGVSWRARFTGSSAAAPDGIRVVARRPWGAQLPRWLPQDRSVWSGSASWVLALPAPVATPAALR